MKMMRKVMAMMAHQEAQGTASQAVMMRRLEAGGQGNTDAIRLLRIWVDGLG